MSEDIEVVNNYRESEDYLKRKKKLLEYYEHNKDRYHLLSTDFIENGLFVVFPEFPLTRNSLKNSIDLKSPDYGDFNKILNNRYEIEKMWEIVFKDFVDEQIKRDRQEINEKVLGVVKKIIFPFS